MLRSERHRLDPAIFNLPVEKMRDGYYSDTYFNRAREILERDNYHPRVRMQVFQRNHSVLCGIDEAIAILKADPYNRTRRHPIKKLEGASPDQGQYRLRLRRRRFRYDIWSSRQQVEPNF